MCRIFSFIALFILFNVDAFAKNYSNRADYHAPIGVMRDHVHEKGEAMASYRFSYMKMQGLRDSDSNVSNKDALTRRMVVPIDMKMKMDMFSLMYGLTDDLTVAAMGTVATKEMNHQRRNGSKFKRESEGVGDVKISGLYRFYEVGGDRVLLNIGVSLPTGSTDEHFAGARLPYPMQMGSGSYEALPGLSYTALRDGYSYGGQVNAALKLNSNNNGYKLGDSYNVTAWVAKSVDRALSFSARFDYNKVEAIEGRDVTLNSAMIVTADPSVQDREYMDVFIGSNYVIPDNIMKDFRLSLEVGSPVYQRFDGDMLETDYKVIVGVQKVL